jgi:hypothetical protein
MRDHVLRVAEAPEPVQAMAQWRPPSWPACRLQMREELALLRRPQYWATLLGCAAMQYIHGIAAQAAMYMHNPSIRLHDLGFELVKEWSQGMWWFSELVTIIQFSCFALFLGWPLAAASPRAHPSIVILRRAMVTVAVCQLLRVLSFTVTQLPAPSHHCQPGVAEPVWPATWMDWLIVDVKRQASHGCGDLIFSSHVTFGWTFTLAIWHFSSRGRVDAAFRAIMASSLVAQCLGIIGARKHYTVDVVVALYVVPLVWEVLLRRMTDPQPGRAIAAAANMGRLLPK